MKIVLNHPQTSMVKTVKVGFSWTMFFFGFFVPLFRGDWKWAIIIFLTAAVTFSLSSLIFMFIYNKIYINELLEKGYVAADGHAENVLASKGIIARAS